MKINQFIKRVKDPKVSSKQYIPVYSPYFFGREKEYLSRCIDSTWLSAKGDFVSAFEQAFACFCQTKYAIACSSGTSALQLALVYAGVTRGDEVILPTFTMIATAFAVSYLGAKPVFVDCLCSSGNINPDQIEPAITKKTKAIIPVHIYGNPANLSKINKIARKYNLIVIEDAAEAIGSTYQGKRVGGISNLSAFSLYINKIITTGQGGIITTSSRKAHQELKRLNNFYFSPARHFWHRKIGYNMRMSNLQAAVGLAQIENIEKILTKKKRLALWYKKLLLSAKKYFIPLRIKKDVVSNFWHIAYRVTKEKYNVFALRNYLAKNGVETRSFFIPLHLQPVYRKRQNQTIFPNAEKLFKTGILLPSGSNLSRQDVARICALIKKYFETIL